MIYGIGTDLVTISRIGKMCKNYGANAVAEKILSRIESLEWPSASNPVLFLAKRFAAKEAFAKAVHTGLRSPVSLRNIGIGHDELGRPEFICEPALQQWLAEKGIGKVHLSLSDEIDQVVAFVIAEMSIE
ncbi:holo-ACP synthase [Snodgrassella sp. CFCC 13594]|uniref:holo-ACP synthase n=1 Tax=Snodgrassella sp. CFCC 13594 TaxID=1775559 RepID=UPI00082A114B|nr:holo-ACP synthase [Snodgrassella sp. CFCC 13594]